MDDVEESTSRVWQSSGATPPDPIEFDKVRGHLIYLPYHVRPMWPEPLQCPATDLHYCVCVQCGTFTQELVQVVLEMDQSWAVRVRCWKCYPPLLMYTSFCESILTVRERVEPILLAACRRRDDTCEICEKQGGCDNPEQCQLTRTLIGRTETEDLLEYFYRIELDIVSVLRFKVCHRQSCDVLRTRMVNCSTCHRVCYCSEQCKKMDKPVHRDVCIPYKEIWRSCMMVRNLTLS